MNAMRSLLVLGLAIGACLPMSADYVPTSVKWKGWQVASSENLYAGRIHTSYPLTYMLDGDPRTAWIFSGTGKCKDGIGGNWNSRYAILFQPEKPFYVDGVRIMNGYNKSPELFQKNSRITHVCITDGRKMLKMATLSDKLGWHTISIPRRAVRCLVIELTGIRRGPNRDICISEMVLYDRGRKIDTRMPQAVMFTKGSECG